MHFPPTWPRCRHTAPRTPSAGEPFLPEPFPILVHLSLPPPLPLPSLGKAENQGLATGIGKHHPSSASSKSPGASEKGSSPPPPPPVEPAGFDRSCSGVPPSGGDASG